MSDNKPDIRYGVKKKGYRYEEDLNVNKPESSNSAVIIFDTGNALITGKVYDHHQLSDSMKERFPSATSILGNSKTAMRLYESCKDKDQVKLVCHDNPDNDAILSVALASFIIEKEGKLPLGFKELIKIANESDTYNFKPGFNFGSFLDSKLREYEKIPPYQKAKQQEFLEDQVAFVKDMLIEFQKVLLAEPDLEKRNELSMDQMLNEMAKYDKAAWEKYGRVAKLYQERTGRILFKELREAKSNLNKKAEEDRQNYYACKKNLYPTKYQDKVQVDGCEKGMNLSQNGIGYDEFKVHLCEKQKGNETDKPIKSAEKESKVFVYTGTKRQKPSFQMQAKQEYDLVIMPTYNNESKTVTVKISTGSQDVDMGDLGKYIESLIFKDNLDPEFSLVKDPKKFKENREEFIRKIKPLGESQKDNHFTGYDSLCGNDKSFFGYTVPYTSNLYRLSNLKGFIMDYMADPERITKDKFVEIIGEDNYKEIEEKKNKPLSQKNIVYAGRPVPDKKIKNVDKEIEDITDELSNMSKEESEEILNQVNIEDNDLDIAAKEQDELDGE